MKNYQFVTAAFLATALCFTFSSVAKAATSIDYSYDDAADTNAALNSTDNQYFYSADNVELFQETAGEGGSDYFSTASGGTATLTYEFALTAPIDQAHLLASIAAFNYTSSGYGSAALYASNTDSNFSLLLNVPTPSANSASTQTYDSDLPSDLLGSDTIYIQVVLNSTSAPGNNQTIFGQFSRTDNQITPTGPIFAFTASSDVPEPSSSALLSLAGGLAFLAMFIRRKSVRA